MNETETQTGEETVDWNAIADVWMGTTTEETQEEETTQDGGGAEAENSAETSNEVPNPPVARITREQEDEIFNRRLNQQLESVRQAKAQKDLEALLNSGTDEEVAELTRRQYQEARVRQAEEELTSGAETRAILASVNELLDDQFVGSLTPEEANRLLADELQNNPKQWLRAITDMKAEKARTGLFTQEDVERLVQERLTTQQNVNRGQQFRAPSITQAPNASAVEDRFAGLEGRALQDARWSAVTEGWDSNQSNDE